MTKEDSDKKTTKAEKPGGMELAAIKTVVSEQLQGVLGQIQEALAKRNGLERLAAAYIESVKHSRLAVKNATNPHLRNTYADLGAVLDAVRDAFLSNDLWLVQSPGEITIKDGNPYIALHGLLIHKSGESISFKSELPAFTLNKQGQVVLNPQTSGSATSYARRYMWLAIAGITQVDDDADAASYMDQAEGPANQPAATQQSTPEPSSASESKGDAKVDDMIARIMATKSKSFDDLKALRSEATAMNNARVKAAYMDVYEHFKNQEQ